MEQRHATRVAGAQGGPAGSGGKGASLTVRRKSPYLRQCHRHRRLPTRQVIEVPSFASEINNVIPKVGARVQVYWHRYQCWYEGVITAERKLQERLSEHRIIYDDADDRWHNFSEIQWVVATSVRTGRQYQCEEIPCNETRSIDRQETKITIQQIEEKIGRDTAHLLILAAFQGKSDVQRPEACKVQQLAKRDGWVPKVSCTAKRAVRLCGTFGCKLVDQHRGLHQICPLAPRRSSS